MTLRKWLVRTYKDAKDATNPVDTGKDTTTVKHTWMVDHASLGLRLRLQVFGAEVYDLNKTTEAERRHARFR